MHADIDDLLIQSRSRAQAMMDTRTVIPHLSRLDLPINVEKSAFMPQQTAVFLGIHLDSYSHRDDYHLFSTSGVEGVSWARESVRIKILRISILPLRLLLPSLALL